MPSTPLYLSIDVGTGSARVAIFTSSGQKLANSCHDIITRNPAADHYEQSTDNIWTAIKTSIHDATSSLKPPYFSNQIVALGVDATCSLVACSETSFASVSISADDHQEDIIFNVVLWRDHRAAAEASFINNHQHHAIQQVRHHFGGKINPENEPPKLLWLHNNKPHVIQQSVFFDLADWITFRCTGDSNVRSSCTLACKWGWGSNDSTTGEWSKDFWETLNLGELCANDFRKIGRQVIEPGKPIATISDGVAKELGLSNHCLVASPMIDAYAGALWTLGLTSTEVQNIAPAVAQRLSVIAGTSTCYIQVSKQPVFVHGVWGPFRDAILPGYHVTEGGQSVTGELLKNTVQRHPSYTQLKEAVGIENVYDALTEVTEFSAQSSGVDPAEDVHCLDHHAGNRSPLADPSLKGCMIGLTLEDSKLDLAIKFRATMQSLCCGARSIIDAMVAAGHETKLVALCGGLCKSKLFVTELADCIGLPVAVSSEKDTVLLGGAILARAAHALAIGEDKHVSCLTSIASEMASIGEIVSPNIDRRQFYDRKYAVYRKMQEDFQNYRKIMRG